MGAVPTMPPLRVAELRDLLLAPAGPLSRVEIVERTESTNSDLAADLRADPASWPDASVLVAEYQAGGRGRAGRSWETPAGTALTCSFVTHPPVPADVVRLDRAARGPRRGQRPAGDRGVPATLKWPNDLLVPAETEIDGWGAARKIGGILTEVVTLPRDSRRRWSSASGSTSASPPSSCPCRARRRWRSRAPSTSTAEGLLVALVDAQLEVAQRWRDSGGDARGSGLADEVAAVCSTLGTVVTVELPGGGSVSGLAARLDDDGALVVVDDHGAGAPRARG